MEISVILKAVDHMSSVLNAVKAASSGMFDDLNKQAKQTGKAFDNMSRTGRGGRDWGRTFDAMQTGARRAQSRFEEMGQRFERMQSRSIAGMGMAAAAAFTLKQPIDQAIQFESAMADVSKAMGLSRESTKGGASEFDRMGQSILRMSREMPLAATELAQIATSAGLMGVGSKEKTFEGRAREIEGFVRTASKMAVAFDMTAEQAGDSMATISNVMRIPLKDMNKFGGVINYLADSMEGTVEAKDIVNVLSRVGGIGNQIGMSQKNLAALSSTMLALGDPPEVAATAIASFTTDLYNSEKQLPKFKNALRSIGLDATEFGKLMKKDSTEGLNTFMKAMEKVDPTKVSGILNDMFGDGGDTRALAKLVQNRKMFEEAIKMANDSSKTDTSMDREFQNRLNTTENQIKRFQNSIAEISINTGTALLPAINAVLKAVTPLTQGFATFASNNKGLTTAIVATIAGLAGFVGVVSAAQFAIGSVGSAFVTTAMAGAQFVEAIGSGGKALVDFSKRAKSVKKVTNAVEAATNATQLALDLGELSSDIGKAGKVAKPATAASKAAGMAGDVGRLGKRGGIGKALEIGADATQLIIPGLEAVNSAAGKSPSIFAKIGSAITSAFSKAGSFLAGFGGKIGAVFMGALTAIPTLFGGLGAAIVGFFTGIPAAIGGIFAGLGSAIAGTLGAIGAAIVSPAAAVIAAVVAIGAAIYWVVHNFQAVSAFFSGFWDGLMEGLAPVAEAFAPIGQAIQSAFSAIGTALAPAINAVKSAFAGIGSAIMGFLRQTGFIGDSVNKNAASFRSFGHMLGSGLAGAIKGVVGLFVGLGAAIGAVGSFIGSMISGIGSAISGIASMFAGIGSAIAGFFGGVGSMVMGAVSAIGAAFSSVIGFVSAVFQFLAGLVVGFTAQLLAPLAPIGQAIAQPFIQAGSAIATAWNNIVSAVSAGISSAIAAVTGFASAIGSVLSQAGQAIASALAPVGAAIAQAFTGMASFGSQVAAILGSALGQAVSVVGSAFAAIGSAVATGLSSIISAVGGLVVGIGAALINGLMSIVSGIGGVLSNIGSAIMSGLQALGNLGALIGNMFNQVSGTADGQAFQAGSQIGQTLAEALQSGLSSLGSIAEVAIGQLMSAFAGMGGKIQSALSSALNFGDGGAGAAGSGIVQSIVGSLGGINGAITSALSGVGSAISSAFSGITSSISQALSGVISAVSEAFSGVNTAIASALSGVGATVLAAFSGIIGAISAALSGIGSSIATALSGAVMAIVPIFSQIGTALQMAFQSLMALPTQITAIVTQIGAALMQIPVVAQMIVPGIQAAFMMIVAIFQQIPMAVMQVQMAFMQVGSAAMMVGSMVVSAFTMIIGAIQNMIAMFSTVPGVVQSVGAQMVGIIQGIAGQMFSAGANIVTQLAAGIQSAAGAAVAAIASVASAVRGALPFSPAKWGPLSDLDKIKFTETVADAITTNPLTNAVAKALQPTRDILSEPMQLAAFNVGGVSPYQFKQLNPDSAITPKIDPLTLAKAQDKLVLKISPLPRLQVQSPLPKIRIDAGKLGDGIKEGIKVIPPRRDLKPIAPKSIENQPKLTIPKIPPLTVPTIPPIDIKVPPELVTFSDALMELGSFSRQQAEAIRAAQRARLNLPEPPAPTVNIPTIPPVEVQPIDIPPIPPIVVDAPQSIPVEMPRLPRTPVTTPVDQQGRRRGGFLGLNLPRILSGVLSQIPGRIGGMDIMPAQAAIEHGINTGGAGGVFRSVLGRVGELGLGQLHGMGQRALGRMRFPGASILGDLLESANGALANVLNDVTRPTRNTPIVYDENGQLNRTRGIVEQVPRSIQMPTGGTPPFTPQPIPQVPTPTASELQQIDVPMFPNVGAQVEAMRQLGQIPQPDEIWTNPITPAERLQAPQVRAVPPGWEQFITRNRTQPDISTSPVPQNEADFPVIRPPHIDRSLIPPAPTMPTQMQIPQSDLRMFVDAIADPIARMGAGVLLPNNPVNQLDPASFVPQQQNQLQPASFTQSVQTDPRSAPMGGTVGSGDKYEITFNVRFEGGAADTPDARDAFNKMLTENKDLLERAIAQINRDKRRVGYG